MLRGWYVLQSGTGHWPMIDGKLKLEQGWIHRRAEDEWLLFATYRSDEAIGPFPTLESAKAAHAILYS